MDTSRLKTVCYGGSPMRETRNGVTITERTTITSQQAHYDGLCSVCNGTGVVEQP